MSTVEKVTVSLPAELLTRIERRRQDRHANRSEVVTELLWRGWRQVEDEDRRERARAAYAAHPETEEQLAWADFAADELFGAGAESVPAARGARAHAAVAVTSPTALRRWATENGFTVGNRGRIPATVREAYEEARAAR